MVGRYVYTWEVRLSVLRQGLHQALPGDSDTNTRGDKYTITRGIHVGYAPIKSVILRVPGD